MRLADKSSQEGAGVAVGDAGRKWPGGGWKEMSICQMMSIKVLNPEKSKSRILPPGPKWVSLLI